MKGWFPKLHELWMILGLLVIHQLLTVWSLTLVTPQERISLMWLPDGYLLACLVLLPLRLWPTLILGVIASLISVELLTTDRPLWLISSFMSANLIESVGGAIIFRRFCGGTEGFQSFRQLTLFLLGCVLAFPILTAFIGASAVVHAGYTSDFQAVYRTWVSSAGLGILLVAPLILNAWQKLLSVKKGLGHFDPFVLLMVLAVAGVVLLSSYLRLNLGTPGFLIVFLTVPLLCWLAIRRGVFGAIVGSASMVILSVQLTAAGYGPFANIGESVSIQVLELQAYLVATIVASLYTAVAVDNLKRTSAELRTSSDRYQVVFKSSPVSLWEEDFSRVKRYLDQLAIQHPNLRSYLEQNPAEVKYCAGLVRIVGLNDQALRTYVSGARETGIKEIGQVFDETTWAMFAEELITLHEGRDVFRGECSQVTLSGERIDTLTSAVIVPGFEESWARVIVSVQDITDLKQKDSALRFSQAQLRQMTDHVPAAIFQYILHQEGGDSIIYMSPGCMQLWEVSAESVTENAQVVWDMVLPEDRPAMYKSVQNSAEKLIPWEHEWRIETPSGVRKWLRGSGQPERLENGDTLWNSLIIDITESQEIGQKLRQAAAVFESTSEGVMIIDPEGVIVEVNPAFTEITGYAPEEIIGKTGNFLGSRKNHDDFYTQLWEQLRAKGAWRGEIWNRRKNGEEFPKLLNLSAIKQSDGTYQGYVGVFSDISYLKKQQQDLDFLANHDPLTSLPNRRLFGTLLERGLAHAKRHETTLAVAFIDLDQFKLINDSKGHPTGDALLVAVANRISDHIREEDAIARISGDEFVVLFEDLQDRAAAQIAVANLMSCFAEPFQLNEIEISATASVGVAIAPDDSLDAETLLAQADSAMFEAKADGRNTYAFYSSRMTREAEERLFLDNELTKALKDGNLFLVYQPQISIESGQLVGMEVLLRWLHPDRGLISPATFIPIAEQSGLIRRIGLWVIEEACKQGQLWLEAGYQVGRVGINLSPGQLLKTELSDEVSEILERTGFPAEHLDLEVTESMFIREGAQANGQLARLRKLGVSVSMDDFGTGYSSLNQLKQLPLDRLKVDQSFVRDIPRDQDDMSITKAIIALGRSLDLSVIAEGVETEAQYEFLKLNGCTEVQGYLFSKPLKADEMQRFLDRQIANTAM